MNLETYYDNSMINNSEVIPNILKYSDVSHGKVTCADVWRKQELK